MKDIDKVSLGKVKYDSLTGNSVIDSTVSQLDPYMNKVLGINKENYIGTQLSKKCFHLKLTSCQPQIIYLTLFIIDDCFAEGEINKKRSLFMGVNTKR